MEPLTSDTLKRVTGRLERLYGADAAPRLAERLKLLLGRYLLTEHGLSKERKPSWDQQDAVLITYGDMIINPGEPGLKTLHRFLSNRLEGVFSDVHILPFFPFSSDDGFSVIDYREVNKSLGSWDDVEAIARDYDLMMDLVINHVSSQSNWFTHYQNGIAPARDYFIEVDPDTDLSAVTRPRSLPLLRPTQTPAGERYVWTTFSDDQIDLDFSNPDVLFEFLEILLFYIVKGARIIRLDAIAYLWKRVGTACINLPETHEIVKLMRDLVDVAAPGVLLLTETNLPHEQNVSYFGSGDEAHIVYQFSLPPLLLHALHTGSTQYLVHWAANLPAPPPGCTFLNFTASHDGIGVRPLEDLVPQEEIDALVLAIKERGGMISTRRRPDGSESPYELNITYYDALADQGRPDSHLQEARFLCSQTIAMALRGIPAVYFHSLTATHNDYLGVERTSQARAINRKRWNEGELDQEMKRVSSHTSRLFHEYTRRLELRTRQSAFHPDGAQEVLDIDAGLFAIMRSSPDASKHILSISNLSSEDKKIDISKLAPIVCEDQKCFDLIQETSVSCRLEITPYQTLWLRSA